MKTTTIHCDTCKVDISQLKMAYKIAVKVQKVSTGHGVVTYDLPPSQFEGDFDFCSLECFRKWSATI